MEEIIWEQNAITVSKYNPELRDLNGSYDEEEWVSYSEIGRIFNGKKFTLEEYILFESKYIKAAKLFLESEGCTIFKIADYENHIDEGRFLYRDRDLIKLYNEVSNEKEFSIDFLENIIKLILRGYIWCGLICKRDPNISVRFGGDYYMFFVNKNKKLTPNLKNNINQLGLFIG